MKPLSIVHVASEFAPLIRVGGRADMVGGLARAQARRGHRVLVALPAYAALTLPEGLRRTPLAAVDVPWGMGRERATFELIEAGPDSPRVLLVGHAGARAFYTRPGIYDDPATRVGFGDNAERFLFFSRAAIEGLKRLGERVDVLHAHDHQAAWSPCFARTHDAGEPCFAGMATVFTIHNLLYQGLYDSWVLALAGFPTDQFFPGAVFEFWGRVNSMKVGIAFSDWITTVSPRHAREIQTSGEFGFGLEGVIARRAGRLRGILNGLDESWNPATDAEIPTRYDATRLGLKAENRAALLAECGWSGVNGRALVGMAAGLEEQKGWDLILEGREELLGLDANYLFVGEGQPRFREALRRLAQERPERVHFHEGRDWGFVRRMLAGSDLFLAPARNEPCGHLQMASLRYGVAPVVHEVGGLADSVEAFDPLSGRGTGFHFGRFEAGELVASLRRALALWRQPALWARLTRNAAEREFAWDGPAEEYDEVYAAALDIIAEGAVPTLETVRADLELRGR